MERRSQRWLLDSLLRMSGSDVLARETETNWAMMGHSHWDVVRVFSQVKAGAQLPKAWTTVAQEVERKALHAEERGYRLTARDLFLRASLLYGKAQQSFVRDGDPRKSALHAKMKECYTKVMQYNPTPIERANVPFDGKTIYTILHLLPEAKKAPCVLLVPGMDRPKEDLHDAAQRHFIPRGMNAIAIDGPGQGESRLHGLKVTPDNYERAARAVVDYLMTRPEVDGDKIALLGQSMGSHWGTRIAANDERIKACAVAQGCYPDRNGTMDVIFNQAQPGYRFTYMYMAGITDEAEFDERITKQMGLRNVASKVKCPYLMVHGEFDELSPLEDALAHYELIRAPKEIWACDNEFHPLGGVATELFSSMADWLVEKLEGKYEPGMDNRIFLNRDGTHVKGTAKPAWWLA